jgi:hypothetical protein
VILGVLPPSAARRGSAKSTDQKAGDKPADAKPAETTHKSADAKRADAKPTEQPDFVATVSPPHAGRSSRSTIAPEVG